MAKTIYSHFIFLLSISILLFFSETTGGLKRSLSFELIYRYSPRSPIYYSNLTDSQRFEDSLLHFENRFLQLNNSQAMSVGYEITAIRPRIIFYGSLYMVFLTIGTGNGTIGYYLSIDTGSYLTWTQCKPCINCYPQNDPYFDPHQSPSFIDISCSHQNPCPQGNYHCINNRCHYQVGYIDGSYTKGTLSKDTFGFRSSHSDYPEFIEGLVFGCSHDSQLVVPSHGYPSGIISLGLFRESFAMQLINHGSQGRFSYCLPLRGSTSMSFLRFGDDIVQRGPVQTTPIEPSQGVCFYYIILNDISVGTKRLGFEPGMFARKPNGSGGFIVDSGAAVSRLITPAFERVKKVLRAYFRHRNFVEVDPTKYGISLKLCWLFQPHYQSLMPSMTFHLQGAEMSIPWQSLFHIVQQKGIFCFAMLPLETLTILGAYQQTNTRFTFDVLQLQLAFNPENCEHDSQP
ncbi:aspartic proteinase nepenthesin-1-like [Ananas comosus]|uniref:Aspartic proteinase nepenthesin-1-like n=1 Tax=Ananas comosus TaxID=4615 RepID=A0A6P5EMD1_ANACO|nr:aspartic proteinase nepenthesin-1-like [Ananas comosus]